MWDRRPRIPIFTAALTLAVTVFIASSGAGVLGGLLAAVVPLVLPVMWGSSYLLSRSLKLHLLGAAVWLVIASSSVPADLVLALAAYVAAGLGMGWAMAGRWRNDLVLGLAVLPIALASAWAVAQMPLADIHGESGREVKAWLAENLPAAVDEEDRQVQLSEYGRWIDQVTDLMAKLWPSVILLGVMAQAGVIFLLLRLMAAFAKMSGSLRPLPPFNRWRMPFYWVWTLVAGLALVAMRFGGLPRIGINVILVALVIMSVQGLAVQINVIGKLMPAWLRIAFWATVALFMAPLVLPSSALLGLIDQWADLRRLAAPVDRANR